MCAGKEIHTLLLVSISVEQPVFHQEKFIPLDHLSSLLEDFTILLFQLSTHCFHLEYSFVVPPLLVLLLGIKGHRHRWCWSDGRQKPWQLVRHPKLRSSIDDPLSIGFVDGTGLSS